MKNICQPKIDSDGCKLDGWAFDEFNNQVIILFLLINESINCISIDVSKSSLCLCIFVGSYCFNLYSLIPLLIFIHLLPTCQSDFLY